MKLTVQDVADRLGCRLVGSGASIVTGVSSVQSSRADALIFVEDAKLMERALGSKAAAIIAGEFTSGAASNKPLLIAAQPRLAFAKAAKMLKDPLPVNDIHPSAIVGHSDHFGEYVTIGPRAVVGQHVRIGDRTTIGPGCVIGDFVEIGAHCRLDCNVSIYSGTSMGNHVIVQAGAVLGSEGFGYVRDEKTGRYEQFPQIGKLVIEDDVEIGANTTIDRGALDETRIGRGTKIDNLVHVGHNVQIGKDVVIAAQTGLSGSAVLEDNVVVGGQVGIADHVHVEDGAILGAQCGVPSSKIIRGKNVVFWGTPARPIQQYLKELAHLARAARQDPETPGE